ncbi:uncharacterized protein PV06_07679 [Exophiala oligosperma]|uniref:Uncharacterized protein n=1 Tax=Exophiala oligosperma TaxID=215243 RepID=A0A0D2DBN4_9EURO|nr:uncharacterized protein PV06_07679 [Exophiala oligosperma]KIW40483.1 hypothetical protein PV06_07679 [Exophiala oligosperma]
MFAAVTGRLPPSDASGLMVLEGPSSEEWALIKGMFIELPDVFSPPVKGDERILLTQSYLAWNVSRWKPLGYDCHKKGPHCSPPDGLPAAFNKCFYDAIPLLLTKRTSEAFEKINLACTLASQCLQDYPYWVFLRLLRLYAYPLWARFGEVRSHMVRYLRLLASRTLPTGHSLNTLLDVWSEAGMEPYKDRLTALLRLTSDLIGPSSRLEAGEWAWVQDEICSLHYQLGGFNDALRIAEWLAEDTRVPMGVRILFCAALNKAREVHNSGNASSIQCRIEATRQQDNGNSPAETSSGSTRANSRWALWAFCRPFS